MDAQVHHTAAAGLREVIEPGLVGSIGVVENQVRGEDLADARRCAPAPPIAEHRPPCDSRNPPPAADRAACGRDGPRRFSGRARQRLLTKHRAAPLQGGDRLLRMQAARRGDDDAIQVLLEQLLEGARQPQLRSPGPPPPAAALTAPRTVGAQICDADNVRRVLRRRRLAGDCSPIQPTPAKPSRGRRREVGRGQRS